jgi:cytochrome c556
MRALIAACFCAAGVFTAAAAIAQADIVKERQELMKGVGKAAKLGGDTLKGNVAYDAAALATAMKNIAAVPDKYVTMFPEGTGNDKIPDSEASPKIWADMEGFKAAAMKMKTAAGAAAGAAEKGEAAFKASFAELTKSCKNCHESYRIKKD